MLGDQRATTNPCIALYGAGPEGERCGSCLRLRATRIPRVEGGELREQTIYYCGLSAGGRRVTAPACAQYVPAALPEELDEDPLSEREPR